MSPTELAALHFLWVWRSPMDRDAKAWLVKATAAEKDLVAAFQAQGVDVAEEFKRAKDPKHTW